MTSDTTLERVIAACFIMAVLCFILAFATPAWAYTTMDDLLSGRYADANVTVQTNEGDGDTVIVSPQPPAVNTQVICTPDFRKCTVRSVEPQPTDARDCPRGQSMVTIRAYGIVSRRCVPN